MSKIKEIQKMIEYMAITKQSSDVQQCKDGSYLIDGVFSMADFTIETREYADYYVDFEQGKIKMHAYYESGHNGSEFSAIDKELDIEHLVSKYDLVKKVFARVVEVEMEAKQKRTEQEIKKARVEAQMQKILGE